MAFERRDILGLVLLAAAALVIRVAALGTLEPWMDEALRVLWAVDSPGGLWEQASIGHAGAVFVLWLSQKIYASHPDWFWLRLPHALAGAILAPLFFLFCRKWISQKTAWIAAGFLAVAPLHVAFARQAEEYSFLCLFALGGLAVGLEIARREKPSAALFALFSLFEVLGLLAGGYLILPFWTGLVLALGWGAFAEKKKETVAGLLLAQIPPLICAFLLVRAWAFGANPGAARYLELMRQWANPAIPSGPLFIPVDLVAYWQAQSWTWGGAKYLAMAGEMVLAAWLLNLAVRGHRVLLRKEKSGAVFGRSVFLAFLAAMGIFLAYLHTPFYFARAYAALSLPFYLLLAAGLEESASRHQKIFAAVFAPLVLGSTILLKLDAHPARIPFVSPVLREITAITGKDAAVYIHPGEFASVVRLYDRGEFASFQGLWRDSFSDVFSSGGLLDQIPQEDAAREVGRVSEEGRCLILLSGNVAKARDPEGFVRRELAGAHGYVLRYSGLAGAVELLCPGE